LKNVSTLEYLDLSGCCVKRVSFDEGVCPRLTHLRMKYCHFLQEVGALPPTLVRLELSDCYSLRKIEDLCNLTKLQELDIRDCVKVQELPSLERLISLEKFRATGCPWNKRRQWLAALTKLRVLHVGNRLAINGEDLEVKCASSKDLDVEGVWSLEKLYIEELEAR
jgi:Leucine-rich repeat (LRR) protein